LSWRIGLIPKPNICKCHFYPLQKWSKMTNILLGMTANFEHKSPKNYTNSIFLELTYTPFLTTSNFFLLCIKIKLSCDSRFQRAFTACSCVFKVITLVWANQGISLKTQPHAVNACVKRSSQRIFIQYRRNRPSTCSRKKTLEIKFYITKLGVFSYDKFCADMSETF